MEIKKIPSKYQVAIHDEYIGSNCNLIIKAGPGSGKSHTIQELLKITPRFKKCILISFNKSIKEELEKKVPVGVTVKTIHGLAFSILNSVTHKTYKVNGFKNFILGKKHLNLDKLPLKQRDAYLFLISKIIDLSRMNLAETKEDIEMVCDQYGISTLNGEIQDTLSLIKYLDHYNENAGQNMMVDFTDMLYLTNKTIKKELFPKYDVVFCDELQDLNPLQKEIVEKIIHPTKGRFIGVGDEKQCQPEGTQILMSDGFYKNIEDINIGDRIVSYCTQVKGGFVGYYADARSENYMNKFLKESQSYVEQVEKRYIEEGIIKLTSNDKVSRYTYNHRCMFRWREDKKQAHALYLMKKGDWFRIGITPLWTKNEQGSVTFRAKCEDADKMWVLNIYETKKEAYANEQFYSVKYRLPQMIFKLRQVSPYIEQKDIDNYYNRFDNGFLTRSALAILSDFHKREDLPFWQKGEFNYNSKLHLAQIFACNIFGEYMQVAHFNKELNKKRGRDKAITYLPDYKNIDRLEREIFEGEVYSLKVNKYETYVADGILTHNSIYSFLGANSQAFESFVQRPNTKVLPLSVTYRCGKRIVDAANQIFPGLEPFEANIDGVVRKGSLDEVEDGDFVICRNNLPLIESWINIVKQGKKASILGKEFGQGLVVVINKLSNYSDYIEGVNQLLKDKEGQLKEKGITNPKVTTSYQTLVEKLNIVDILKKEFGSFELMKTKVEQIFTDNDHTSGVLLMTGHKSKGLETDRVFFLYPSLIPSKYAESFRELQQEQCLKYVIVTRAKKELIYID